MRTKTTLCVIAGMIFLGSCGLPSKELSNDPWDFSMKGKGEVYISWNTAAGDAYLNDRRLSKPSGEFYFQVDVGDNKAFTLRFVPRGDAEFLGYSLRRAGRDFYVYTNSLQARADDAAMEINIRTSVPGNSGNPVDEDLTPPVFTGISRIEGSDLIFFQKEWEWGDDGPLGMIYDPSRYKWYKTERLVSFQVHDLLLGLSLEDGVLSGDVLGDGLPPWNLLANPMGRVTTTAVSDSQSAAMVSFRPDVMAGTDLLFQEWRWSEASASSRILNPSGPGALPMPASWWDGNRLQRLNAGLLAMVTGADRKLWLIDLEQGEYSPVDTMGMVPQGGRMMSHSQQNRVLVNFDAGWYWLFPNGTLTMATALVPGYDEPLCTETDNWLIRRGNSIRSWKVDEEEGKHVLNVREGAYLVPLRSGLEFFLFEPESQTFYRGRVEDGMTNLIALPSWDTLESLE